MLPEKIAYLYKKVKLFLASALRRNPDIADIIEAAFFFRLSPGDFLCKFLVIQLVRKTKGQV